MTTHTQLLNFLAETFNLQSYLEIGINNPANNFDKIVCQEKTGVDPEHTSNYILQTTSDLFFDTNEITNNVFHKMFDLIFIDGLHHADQVKRDFENSLKCLSDHGYIVIHDTLPDKEEYTHVPRDSKIWYGDVYKFACSLGNYPDIDFWTIEMDCGCTVVWKEPGMLNLKFPEVKTWDDYLKHKTNLMLISPEQFITVMQESVT